MSMAQHVSMPDSQHELWPKNHYLKDEKTIREEHESFKRRLKRYLPKDQNGVRIASSNGELREQINYIKRSPQDQASSELMNAQASHELYTKKRLKGPKRFGRQAQEWITILAEFTEMFSEILEGIAQMGGIYGQIGYQTLSILFWVVGNKSKNDKKLLELLAQFRSSIPRLGTLGDIYPEIQSQLTTAYGRLVEFSRAVAEYFASFPVRVLVAITNSKRIVDMAAEVDKSVADINRECMVRLHERLQRSMHQIGDIARENDEMKNLLQRMDAENHDRSIKGFKKLLLGNTFPQGTSLEKARHTLEAVFPNSSHYNPRDPYSAFNQMSPSQLARKPALQQWLDAEVSSIFFLGGKTQYHGRRLTGTTHCWLSPAAIHVAESLRKAGKKVAFYSSLPDLSTTNTTGDEAKCLISSIIWDIIQWNSQILRSVEDQLRDQLEASDETEKAALSALFNILIVLLLERKGTDDIYVILDRVDYCDNLHRFMDEWVRVARSVSAANFNIKILAVSETSGGRGDWKSEFLPDEKVSQINTWNISNWDQEAVSSENKGLPRHLTWGDTDASQVLLRTEG
ncbi:hypothetical protein GQ53DRAFT_845121 [Thozetella sp. PMI_491]|nr:hypothetical protein GQ53DRAFT_845121 [Thozetella sp. PMI_491]